jgi:RimJ/RimL family protein N-acetyltransferase
MVSACGWSPWLPPIRLSWVRRLPTAGFGSFGSLPSRRPRNLLFTLLMPSKAYAPAMLPWAVRELVTGAIVGSTRYHDVVAKIDRVEIGYTWYATRWQRSHVNTACKMLLLTHAFEVLECRVVGLRTDNFNFASQRAIAALGARKDGVIRHHNARRDG